MTNQSQLYLLFAWLIALVALIGSLYAEYYLGMPVCHLCWLQRICLYPLVILLGMATFKNDNHIVPYALPLSVLALIFSAYQYMIQMIPGFEPIHVCTPGTPQCSTIHMQLYGFITLPFISLLGCLAITILLVLARPRK